MEQANSGSLFPACLPRGLCEALFSYPLFISYIFLEVQEFLSLLSIWCWAALPFDRTTRSPLDQRFSPNCGLFYAGRVDSLGKAFFPPTSLGFITPRLLSLTETWLFSFFSFFFLMDAPKGSVGGLFSVRFDRVGSLLEHVPRFRFFLFFFV